MGLAAYPQKSLSPAWTGVDPRDTPWSLPMAEITATAGDPGAGLPNRFTPKTFRLEIPQFKTEIAFLSVELQVCGGLKILSFQKLVFKVRWLRRATSH